MIEKLKNEIILSRILFILFLLTFIPASILLINGNYGQYQKVCVYEFYILTIGVIFYVIENFKSKVKSTKKLNSLFLSKLFFALLILTIFIVYWRVFLPHLHVANDLHATYQDELKAQLTLPYLWSNEGAVGLGEFSAFGIWNWPIEVLFGLFGIFGFSHSFLNQYFALGFGFIAAIVGINLILTDLRLSAFSRFCATLIFLLNSYLLLLVDGGQLTIALAYLYFPITYYFFIKSTKRGLAWIILTAFLTTLIGIFDLRFLYLLFLLIGARFLFFIPQKYKLKYFLRWFFVGIAVLLIFIILNSYWIIPALFSRGPNLPLTYGRASQTQFLNFTSMGHALLLQQPHWYLNVFGKTGLLRISFIIFPILAFISAIYWKNKTVAFWLCIALISLFLTKGSNVPFGQVYDFLFTKLPGFNLFRDSSKFYFLAAFAYSILVGFTSESFLLIIRKHTKRFNKYIFLTALILSIYLVITFSPVWSGKMTGTFNPPIYQNEFKNVNSILRNDKDYGRVLWIPTKAALGLSSPIHPALETSRLSNIRPFATAIVGAYETNNFLREANYIKDLMNIAAISYVAYPYPDTRRETMKTDNIEYYYNFLDQLKRQNWSGKVISKSPVALIKTNSNSQHIFLTSQNYWVIGSDRLYSELNNYGIDIKNKGLIFTEEKFGILNNLDQVNSYLPILLYKRSLTDVAVLLTNTDSLISPAKMLNFEPNENGWWKRESADMVKWRDFLQQKYSIDNLDFDYGEGWAVSEGKLKLKVDGAPVKKGRLLLARVMKSSKGGLINFSQDGNKIGSAYTKEANFSKVTLKITGNEQIPNKYFDYEDTEFKWFVIGKLISDSEIVIDTDGEINVINVLMSVDMDIWQKNIQDVDNLNKQGKILSWEELSKSEINKKFENINNSQISITKINPARYKVNIKDLTNPTILAFSESYDPLWEIKSDYNTVGKSIPLFSFINGFYVENDGDYEIYLVPQKYVIPSVYVSVLGFLILNLTLVLIRLHKI